MIAQKAQPEVLQIRTVAALFLVWAIQKMVILCKSIVSNTPVHFRKSVIEYPIGVS